MGPDADILDKLNVRGAHSTTSMLDSNVIAADGCTFAALGRKSAFALQ